MDRFRSDGADGEYGGTQPVAYSVAESSKILRMGLNQTYEAIHKGEIPSVRIGRRLWVPAWFFRKLRGDVPPAAEQANSAAREM
jgi:excisionase family DNA binding protein